MDTLDDPDLDLVAALQLAPRAGIQDLADALGVSTGTVSRRFGRLREQGLVRVLAQLPWQVGREGNPHHVWISTSPGTAESVASTIAERDGTRFAAVTAGRADVYCILHPATRSEIVTLLTSDLPSVPGVVGSHSDLGLHMYTSGASWRLPRLSQEQQRRLAVAQQPVPSAASLTPEETEVARVLQRNGRATAAEIARELGKSTSTAYRLAQSLLDRGLVQPRVEIEPVLLGYPLEAVLSLSTSPGSMGDIADALAGHPSARYVATVAGSASVIHHGLFRDEADLATFLTHDLARHQGIIGFEVSVVLRVLTRYWSHPTGVVGQS